MPCLPLLSIVALLALPAAAPQEPVEPEKPSPVEALERLQGGGEQDEMAALFAEVERRLRDIDRMLYDASAGRPAERAQESGIDKLLRTTQLESKQVIEGIDQILKLAAERAQEQRQQQQQQQGGGQQQQSQQGDSPLDQQRNGQPGQRERTPEGTSPERQGGDEPQPGGDDPQGERPDSPRDSGSDDAQNRPGAQPPANATESGQAGSGDDRWGDLPVHVRELFRAQGGDDMPPRFRDWIDAYYRRLNERP